MSKIVVGIFDEHAIVQEALCALLSTCEDFEPVILTADRDHLIEQLRKNGVNILIINMHTLDIVILNLITRVSLSYPKSSMLVLSHTNKEEIIIKTIKAGAKGLLDKEASKNELAEAIYTLRNGYDYYSKSIAHLLLNKYLNKMKTKEMLQETGIDSLSSREIEILKLWGNNYSNKEIAEKLFISVRTVESHKNHIMQKLNFKTTVDMIKFGIKNNLIEI